MNTGIVKIAICFVFLYAVTQTSFIFKSLCSRVFVEHTCITMTSTQASGAATTLQVTSKIFPPFLRYTIRPAFTALKTKYLKIWNFA